MSFSTTNIANMALGHLGQGLQIDDFDTDTSPAGKACRAYYELARDATLERFPWAFAVERVALALVGDGEDEHEEWEYVYQVPSDCLAPRRILSGTRNDNPSTVVRYVVKGDQIFTDMEDAVLEYTKQVTNAPDFPPSFVEALSYKLAQLISPRVAKDAELGGVMLQMHEMALARAAGLDADRERPDAEPDSEGLRSRL